MILKACKRPVKVDFPIAEVSWDAVRGGAIGHVDPSTPRVWWAPRGERGVDALRRRLEVREAAAAYGERATHEKSDARP